MDGGNEHTGLVAQDTVSEVPRSFFTRGTTCRDSDNSLESMDNDSPRT